jgi:Ca2+:H+ antiporter
MGEPDDPSLFQSVKSKAKAFGLGRGKDHAQPVLPQHSVAGPSTSNSTPHATLSEKSIDAHNGASSHNAVDKSSLRDRASEHTQAAKEADTSVVLKPPMPTRMKNGTKRFINHTKHALLRSWVNILLVFVPIGIAVHLAHLGPEIVFAMNAVAIIPLAGLLSHATEAVAARLGDTLGALLNVSFGNAVELILFIILLANNQIRVVQAALLGSILANLLLILGMAFLLGGLRYQEQVYNSTVTQMSACMLSLAVMSLLLPTAFHSAFSNYSTADKETLYVSRGTSVILLLVYVLYLIFQLKSHSYMYASTPQHIIDEESHPGILADLLDSSSSSDSSSDSSSTASNISVGSNTTAKRIKRAFRHRKRRKSSASSKDTASAPSVLSSQSPERHRQYLDSQRRGSVTMEGTGLTNPVSRRASVSNAIMSGDEADTDEAAHNPVVRDFETGSTGSASRGKREKQNSKKKKKKHGKHSDKSLHDKDHNKTKVAFAEKVETAEAAPITKRLIPVPSLLSNNVFSNPQKPPPPPGVSALSNVRMAGPRSLRRTASLPDRMSRVQSAQPSLHDNTMLSGQPSDSPDVAQENSDEEEVPLMSRTAAVVMLVISTALVAVCADFLSDAIEPLVEKTNVSQAFIGLIILPIVGNAAEHVTAVSVAMKNKMDLAIGVAVGSSIQIGMLPNAPVHVHD